MTRNAEFVPRFQELCEKHGLKPTYLTNYEMAKDPSFVELGRDAVSRGVAEVGMHLHAWNTPPLDHTLTDEDYRHVPFLVEYPADVMRAKVQTMTTLLEETFGRRPTSHRAGRWIIDSDYVKILIEDGYTVDCSVTPNVDWTGHPGALDPPPAQDYRRFPSVPYFMDPDHIDQPGDSPLLQVPMTVEARAAGIGNRIPSALYRGRYPSAVLRRVFRQSWLRPRGNNGDQMVELVEAAVAKTSTHVEFMIHSSELMPGGSPTSSTAEHVERLYADMERVFSAASSGCCGMTLAEFHDHHVNLTA